MRTRFFNPMANPYKYLRGVRQPAARQCDSLHLRKVCGDKSIEWCGWCGEYTHAPCEHGESPTTIRQIKKGQK